MSTCLFIVRPPLERSKASGAQHEAEQWVSTAWQALQSLALGTNPRQHFQGQLERRGPKQT